MLHITGTFYPNMDMSIKKTPLSLLKDTFRVISSVTYIRYTGEIPERLGWIIEANFHLEQSSKRHFKVAGASEIARSRVLAKVGDVTFGCWYMCCGLSASRKSQSSRIVGTQVSGQYNSALAKRIDIDYAARPLLLLLLVPGRSTHNLALEP